MPKKPINENKLALDEEKENLKRIENRIEALIRQDKATFDSNQKELSTWRGYDYEDRMQISEKRKEQEFLENRMNRIGSYIDSPYFAHMDMVTSGENMHSFFIGKEGLSQGSDQIIMDWRSPMGNTYYNKQKKQFNVEGILYDLALRRAVDIKNAKIRNVKTEFDMANAALEGEIVDEFLISVLRDKRRNYRLTDIIKTIQENQNQLINIPASESFIVQGCAGSGKTMILLHRLSFIAFNNPGVDFSKFYILTPNENFNLHVNDLSRELGLEKISRITTEAFYAKLINDLARGDNAVTPGGKRVRKLTASVKDLRSEKLLNADMLSEIYSEKMYSAIIRQYSEHSKAAARELEALDIPAMLQSRRRPVRGFVEIGFSAYSDLSASLNDLLSKHDASYTEAEKNKNELQAAKESLLDAEKLAASRKNALEEAKEALLTTCIEKSDKYDGLLVSGNEKLKRLSEAIGAADREKAALNERITAVEAFPAFSDRLQDPAGVYQLLGSAEEAPLSVIRSRCQEEIDAVRELHTQMGSVAFYNFGKRARVRAELEAAERKLSEKAVLTMNAYLGESENDTGRMRERIGELNALIENSNRSAADTGNNLRSYAALRNAFRACRDILEEDGFPGLSTRLPASDLELLEEDCKLYVAMRQQYHAADRKARSRKSTVEHLEQEISRLEASILSEEEFTSMTRAYEIVQQFNIKNLLRAMDRDLKKLYGKYGQPFTSAANYRHRLYLKLLLCHLYYGGDLGTGYHISVDEAQDLAPAEFKLLRDILGSRTVFELYGDVNQNVYEYKGISDWSDVADSISPNVYLLNENYRNTIQITQYCNNVFGAEVTAIGLSGAEVRKPPLDRALTAISKILKDDPESRCAVIYKRGLTGLEEEIRKNPAFRLSFHEIKQGAVSVITVEESKGLEFDAVVVVEDFMTINEKYVSYTRALDNLIITALPQAGFKAEEDVKEDEEIGEDIPDNEAEEILDDVVDTEEEDVNTEAEAPEPVPAAEDAEEEDASYEDLPQLKKTPVDVPVSEGKRYAAAFFKGNREYIRAFAELTKYASESDPDVLVRASTGYIGIARADEKTRFYVSESYGTITIKFIHLDNKETFDPFLTLRYMGDYDQCRKHIEQHPIPLQSKK